VYTDNNALLEKLLKKDGFLSNLFERWAPETNFNAIELAFKKQNDKAIKLFLECLKKKELEMTTEPRVSLKHVDTGHVSQYAFGVRVRKVQMARGGRELNNAFVHDESRTRYLSECLENIMESGISNQLFDLLRVHLGDFEIMPMFNKIILSGNYRLGAHVAKIAQSTGGYGLNTLFEEVLKNEKAS